MVIISACSAVTSETILSASFRSTPSVMLAGLTAGMKTKDQAALGSSMTSRTILTYCLLQKLCFNESTVPVEYEGSNCVRKDSSALHMAAAIRGSCFR